MRSDRPGRAWTSGGGHGRSGHRRGRPSRRSQRPAPGPRVPGGRTRLLPHMCCVRGAGHGQVRRGRPGTGGRDRPTGAWTRSDHPYGARAAADDAGRDDAGMDDAGMDGVLRTGPHPAATSRRSRPRVDSQLDADGREQRAVDADRRQRGMVITGPPSRGRLRLDGARSHCRLLPVRCSSRSAARRAGVRTRRPRWPPPLGRRGCTRSSRATRRRSPS